MQVIKVQLVVVPEGGGKVDSKMEDIFMLMGVHDVAAP